MDGDLRGVFLATETRHFEFCASFDNSYGILMVKSESIHTCKFTALPSDEKAPTNTLDRIPPDLPVRLPGIQDPEFATKRDK